MISVSLARAMLLFMMLGSTYSQRDPPWKRVVYSLKSAEETITDAVAAIGVFSETECAFRCKNLTTDNCMAFSLKPESEKPSSFECRIAGTSGYNLSTDRNSSLFARETEWAVGYKTTDGYELAEDGRFYKKYLEPLAGQNTLAHARNACNADGADLAVPYPRFRQLAIINSLGPDISQNFHVGIRRIDPADGVAGDGWMTDDGFTFNSSLAAGDENQAWGIGQPDKDGPALCVDNGRKPAGQWSDCAVDWDMATAISAMYLCRKDSDYIPMGKGGKSYKLYYEKRTHQEAEAICAADMASLANLRDGKYYHAIRGITQRVDDLMGLLPSPSLFAEVGFHVAGNTSTGSNVWVFPDGLSIHTADWKRNSTTDQQWFPNEPSSGRTENCLAYLPGGFADVDCPNVQLRFLCEKTG